MAEALKKLTDLVEQHSLIVLGLVIVLVLLMLSCYFAGKKQGFNPTATMRMTRLDGLGQERATGGPAVAGAAAPASGPAPGSAAYNVLHSPDFACDTRETVGDDAWMWMTKNVGGPSSAEYAQGGKGIARDQLSAAEATRLMYGLNQ